MNYEFSEAFAENADKKDDLRNFRDRFFFPQKKGKDAIYFTGNSLGLQPKTTREYIQQELDDWAKYGVEGHFEAKNPWFSYHEIFLDALGRLVGAKPTEVVPMNGLTVNLHLMMASFYQPKGKRTKIIYEAKAFPSDIYALQSQVKWHGLDPDKHLIEISPRENEHLIRKEDILNIIEETGEELALVMIGGVNYYTGQLFDIKEITRIAHSVGALAGFDLAHAAGNVKLQLHDWEVDFAAWCSYKYLNSGPGGVSGVFISEKHCQNKNLNRLAGWWGHDKQKRFLMESYFEPMTTAEGWQLSNAPLLAMAAHKAALDIHDEAGMDKLSAKSKMLTGYLEFIIEKVSERNENVNFEIITPKDPEERGCQLSILCHGQGKRLYDKITEGGVIADWREPNVIRVAPVPLYNSFNDVYLFGKILEKAIVNE